MSDSYDISPCPPVATLSGVDAMYSLYQAGKSLAQVADVFGVTRQSVYAVFKSRGIKCRAKRFLESILYNGDKYTPGKGGYYRRTRRNGHAETLLHRQMWIDAHGSIPVGHEIHHRDFDRQHNELSNFECLPKSDHTRLYSPHNNQHTRGHRRREFVAKSCVECGSQLFPSREGEFKESPSAFARRKFCGNQCAGMWRRQKPRGAVA